MKITAVLIGIAVTLGAVFAPAVGAQEVAWRSGFSSATGVERLDGRQVSKPRNGRVAMLAFSEGSEGLGARLSLHDVADGRTVWQIPIPRAVGTDGAQRRLAIDSKGDVIVAVTIDDVMWASKFAGADGAAVWWVPAYNVLASGVVHSFALALGPNDSVYVSGLESSGTGRPDLSLVMTIDANGTQQWAEFRGEFPRSVTVTIPFDLAIDAAGDVIVTGNSPNGQPAGWLTKFDFAGRTVWQTITDWPTPHAITSIVMDAAGDAYVTLVATDPVAPAESHIVKYSGGTGAKVWEHALDGVANAAAIGGTGDVVVATGIGAAGTGGWRLTSFAGVTGAFRWESAHASSGRAAPLAMAVDRHGDIGVGGYAADALANDQAQVAKWDGFSGTPLWSLALSGAAQSGRVTALTIDDQGAIYAGGTVADAGTPSASLLAKVIGGAVGMPAPPGGDADGDGLDAAIEAQEGLDARVKDNDVFTSARLFVMQQYRDFLGREGDAAGIAFHVQLINSGAMSRDSVVEAFLASPEFQNGQPQIARLYFSFFNRTPDYDGFLFQLAQLRSGIPLDAIAQNFASSPEFLDRFGILSDAGYVVWVYGNVLGRAPDAGGADYYLQRLGDGRMTRGQVMLAFSESPEFQQKVDDKLYVLALYAGLLRRVPDAAGFAYTLALLDSVNQDPGNREGGLSRGFILGLFLRALEYRGRFLP